MATKVTKARKWQRVKKYPYIPEEIVLSILKNLPIESLLRFRCVSKQLSRWICEGESRNKLMVLHMSSDPPHKSHSFMAIDQTVAQLQVIDVPPPWSNASYVRIHGSCNGLLLMEIDNNLYLWNPSIRWHSHISACDRYNVTIAGLCYDSNRDEYKAVLVWEHDSPSCGVQDIEVCSVKHKSWKSIEEFPYDVESGKPGPAMNDRLHWVVSAEEGSYKFFPPQFIVYFEAKNDKFEKFPMPDVPKEKEGNPILGLGVLDGCLSMVLCEENALYEGPVQILSMKEYGVKESWTILFKIKDITYSTGEVQLVSCFYYTPEGSTSIIMKDKIWPRECSFNVYKTNDASFIKDIAPPLENGNAILYEETFVVPT